MTDRKGYVSPLSTRYASDEMQYCFSDDFKFTTWRRLWVALARAEHKLGLNVTEAQIAELEAHVDDINYDVAEAREKEVRHDVMSHVYAYGLQSERRAHNSSRSDELLRRRQRGRYRDETRGRNRA